MSQSDPFPYPASKRVFDFCVSLSLCIGLSPALLGIPVLVILEDLIRFQKVELPFYREDRVSKGEVFAFYKFRTFRPGVVKDELTQAGFIETKVLESREGSLTAMGHFLKKFYLDELPQIWNVLKGDMSIIGPRPPIPAEVEQYDTWHRRRLRMRPGITCIWQVNGRNNISSFNEWAKLDLEYIDNWSIWLDLKILFKTIPVVLIGAGAK